MDTGLILDIAQLQIRFPGEAGPKVAVKGLDLQLRRGQALGIVGESGSGKSVTALSLMRLLPAQAEVAAQRLHFYDAQGQAHALDQLGASAMRRLRGRHIAMIFQEPMTSLNPVIRCGEQVAEAIRLHLGLDRRAARQRTLDLFARVELPRPEEAYRKYPHQLSGGQKQRVMIALAVSCEPALLIADEPTTALDVTVQQHILRLLRDLQTERQMSLIFITHDLGVVAQVADEVLVMYRGDKMETGSVDALFAQPRHPYTRGLLACRPRMDLRLRRLPVVADFMGDTEETAPPVHERLEALRLPAEAHAQRQARLQAQPPVLEVAHLSKWYPGVRNAWGRRGEPVRAVDDVSFQVFPGETLGLVGESGCGKTTLGRTLLRLIEPTAGTIHYAGQDLCALDAAQMRALRREVQIVFQDPYSSLNPRLPVGRAIREPMQVHGIGAHEREREERVVALLERVGLQGEHAQRYPHEFSGGERQRVCIARALAVSPRFVVCDESVSALDVSVQAQVLNLLRDLQEEMGLTYIFISHDLSVVKYMSDRIMVMQAGRIVELGDAEQVYAQPAAAYTQRLIQAVPRLR